MKTQWTAQKAQAWYQSRPWPCGFNYVPSTAINSTEMWQAETFDPATIDRELGWAQALGLNACRVFLQYLVWEHDPVGFNARFAQFLEIADLHGISVLPVFFDDCAFAGKQPYLGPQDAPTPGVHNSGWTPSPGKTRVEDRSAWPKLEEYVTDITTRFGSDSRVLAWDIYNEPGNEGMGDRSLPLLEAAFGWTRAADPSQPLTAASWNLELVTLNEFSWANSDLISFHSYAPLGDLEAELAHLHSYGRPILCTEWMRRGNNLSLVETHLPILARAKAGSYFWGLVSGKTQTRFPWGSPVGAAEPPLWFHDLLHTDGTPYADAEIAVIRGCLDSAL